MLVLDLGKAAQRALRRMPPKHVDQIDQKLTELLFEPYPNDCKKLKRSVYFRIDSGEYRIVYSVTSNLLVVRLIGKRNDDDVYRRLERLGG